MPDKSRTFYNHLYNNGLYSGFVFWSSLNNSEYEPSKQLAQKVSNQLKTLEEKNTEILAFRRAASRLREMSANEASKEQIWLNSLPGFENIKIDYTSKESAKTIIEALNSIIGTKAEFDRIATLVQANSNIERDVTKYAITKDGEGYIQKRLSENISKLASDKDFIQGIGEFFKNKGNIDHAMNACRKWAINCFSEGILDMLNAGVLKKGDADTYSELLAQIKTAEGKLDSSVANEFAEAAGLNRLIEVMESYLKKIKKSGRKNSSKKLVKTTVEKGIKQLTNARGKWTGDLREALEEVIGNNLNKKKITIGGDLIIADIEFAAKIGGQKLFKTDIYLGFGINEQDLEEILKSDKNDSVDKTTRTKAWEYSKMVQEKLRKFPDAFLIEENAKSYQQSTLKNIDKSKGYGFSTGEYTGASGLNLLYKIHRNNSNITQLYDTLINLGPGLIGENREDIKKSIETQLAEDIGHALFDDHDNLGIEKTERAGTMLHVLLLNGTRIFLSFFYFLLSQAFDRLCEDMTHEGFQEYVYVETKLVGRVDNNSFTYKKDAWVRQKQYSRSNTSISMHFLHNFNEVIEQYIYL